MPLYHCKRHHTYYIAPAPRLLTPEEIASYHRDAALLRAGETDPNSPLLALADLWASLTPGQAVEHPDKTACLLADQEEIR